MKTSSSMDPELYPGWHRPRKWLTRIFTTTGSMCTEALFVPELLVACGGLPTSPTASVLCLLTTHSAPHAGFVATKTTLAGLASSAPLSATHTPGLAILFEPLPTVGLALWGLSASSLIRRAYYRLHRMLLPRGLSCRLTAVVLSLNLDTGTAAPRPSMAPEPPGPVSQSLRSSETGPDMLSLLAFMDPCLTIFRTPPLPNSTL